MNYKYLCNTRPIREHTLVIKALHQVVNISIKYYAASTVEVGSSFPELILVGLLHQPLAYSVDSASPYPTNQKEKLIQQTMYLVRNCGDRNCILLYCHLNKTILGSY
jgi:hypothetical protein